MEQAPDVILVAHQGFNLKAAPNAAQLYAKGIFSGKHTLDDAFLLVWPKPRAFGLGGELSVCDIVNIIHGISGGNQ